MQSYGEPWHNVKNDCGCIIGIVDDEGDQPMNGQLERACLCVNSLQGVSSEALRAGAVAKLVAAAREAVSNAHACLPAPGTANRRIRREED